MFFYSSLLHEGDKILEINMKSIDDYPADMKAILKQMTSPSIRLLIDRPQTKSKQNSPAGSQTVTPSPSLTSLRSVPGSPMLKRLNVTNQSPAKWGKGLNDRSVSSSSSDNQAVVKSDGKDSMVSF